MTMAQELQQQYHNLWQRVVTHPFVCELGDGTLPLDTFRTYFQQDYVFVHDLVTMTALALAKAPSFAAANRLNQFLSGILHPENDLFVRAFAALGVSAQETITASPVTQAFGDFIVRTALQGSFEDIVTVLYVTEGTYLDWGTQLLDAGKHPPQPLYQEWITLHSPPVLGDFVAWLGQHLDSAGLDGRYPALSRLFHTALRYEYLFWEGAYHGGIAWPDQTEG